MPQDTIQTQEDAQILRSRSLDQLDKFGIRGPFIYLIDLIPLIEMIWSDGKAQDSEVTILKTYLPKHVAAVNKMAGDSQFLSLKKSEKFISAFIEKRPDPKLLKLIRNLVASVRYGTENNEINNAIKGSILKISLDIAAAAVTEYPFEQDARFDHREKRCYFEILDSLCGTELKSETK